MLEDIFDLGDSVVFLTYPLPQLRPLWLEQHIQKGMLCLKGWYAAVLYCAEHCMCMDCPTLSEANPPCTEYLLR